MLFRFVPIKLQNSAMKIARPIQTYGRGNAKAGFPGFTLIELLVVIGVIVILASLLLTSLSQAKGRAVSISCLNNEKQLVLACLLYTDDFNDTFPYNLGDDETKALVAKKSYANWVNNVMSWDRDPDNTNTDLQITGGIGPYTSGGVSLYHCPADNVVSDFQREVGWRQRVRSISMNAMVGNAGEFSLSGSNTNNPKYKQFFRVTEVPDASRVFVFIEEHPDSLDDGYFLHSGDKYEWHDVPASYHNGGANVAFVDGHVQYHQWRSGQVRAPAQAFVLQYPMRIKTPEAAADFHWLLDRMSISVGPHSSSSP